MMTMFYLTKHEEILLLSFYVYHVTICTVNINIITLTLTLSNPSLITREGGGTKKNRKIKKHKIKTTGTHTDTRRHEYHDSPGPQPSAKYSTLTG